MREAAGTLTLISSSVGTARKVSPNWSQETTTWQLFAIGDFSSEQLLHEP